MSTSQVAVILTYLIFISCCGISSYAQDLSDIDSIPTANYTIHEYDINDGLRQMQVNDIFVSRRGEIWIGTRAGVCLFDGKNFDGFEDLDVKPDYVCDIGEMADGRIVILSPKYLYFFDGKEFIPKNLSDLKLSYPSLIRTDLQNRVWINKRYSHINKIYKEGAFFDPIDLYPELKDAEVNTIWPSVTGDTIYFISDDRNLISLTEGRQKLIFKSSITMSAITEHWYTPYNTLNRVDNCIAIHERKNINEIRQLVIDLNNESVDTLYDEDVIKSSENHELFHKENDILSIVDSQLYYVIKDADIKYNTILSLYTYDGIHYIGTDKGLVICTPSQFVNYSEEKFNNVWTISEMPDGEIYFSSFSGKFVRLSDEKVIDNYNSFGIDRVYNKYFSAKFRQYYFSSAIGRNGNLYLTSNKGLIRYDGEQLHPFYPKATLGTIRPSLYVYYDKQKDIFLRATCSGVDIIDSDGNLFRKIDTTLFAHRCMLTINQTGEDLYWFGATGGIASYSFTEDTVVNYEYADNRCPIKSVICSYVDYEGNFWIGGKGGLARYDSQLDSFLIVKELQNYNVNSIIQGDKNQLFLGTIRGLLMIDPKIYLKDGVVKSRLYTSKDGMEGIELNQNGFFKDSKGHIWTTSATNVVSFDPQNLQYQKVS